MSKFVHLHTHSHYSLLDGLAKIDDLIARTKELGMDTLAITDHGVLYGAVEFYKKAVKAGIKPIFGVETYVAPKTRFDKDGSEKYYHLILLAENEIGWKNLIKVVTKANVEGLYYKPRLDKELLRENHEGLIALSACLAGEVARNLSAGNKEGAKKVALEYQEIFGKGNYFLEIGDHPGIADVAKVRPLIIELSKETGIPLVATQDIHYSRKDEAEYHDILLAVQTGNNLGDEGRLTLKDDDFSMTSPEEMAEKFKDVPEAIENTVKIGERCNAKLELGKILLPNFQTPEGKSPGEYLRELLDTKIVNRYPKTTPEIKERLEYELGVIEKTGFADYFLIVSDLVNWAKTHGIAVGPGRGSAAGSIISYILGITDVDPLYYGLLFERFLNPERIQMPDIDLDFADTRRDEVLAYAKQKYGEDHVAQIITFGTMAARAAIRDSGRAMGIGYGFCDQIAKLIPFQTKLGDAVENVPELKKMYEDNADAKRLIDSAKHLEGVARHASVHACGTVISKEPLIERVPLQLAPQDKTNIITQFEMHSIEDLGLLKIDLLGLRNLTIIENTVRLIKELQSKDLDISKLPMNDVKTFELLRRGDTTGVFQFESSGMRRYMKDLKPTEFGDLVALVALYRPGPLEMGMVPKYIDRKHGREEVAYLHPKLEPILKDTYGIGVYQEQMMRIARDLAGYTLPEADTLRKAIGKKIKSLLDEQEEKLVKGMIKNGIDQKTAKIIWDLFPPFARYGFNKSHAVCYALIGYQTAYLKAHYPEEFMASLLNAEINDVDRISFLVNEAKETKIEILPPDVNRSFIQFTPEGEKIRFGLLAIKNVGGQIAKEISEERMRNGPFKTFPEFLNRIQHKDLNKKSMESLGKAGVFDSLGMERNQIIQNIDEILRFHNIAKRSGTQNSNSLFGAEVSAGSLKLKDVPPASSQERLAWERELLGFFLTDHPLKPWQERFKAANLKTLEELRGIKNEKLLFRTAGLISKVQKIVTKNGQPMVFITLEDLSPRPIEVLIFNSTLQTTQDVWVQNNIVVLEGHLSWKDNDEPKIICERAKRIEA